MSRLLNLKCLGGVRRWKTTMSVIKPEALMSRLWDKSFARSELEVMHGLSSIRLSKPGRMLGTRSEKKCSLFASHTQSNCFQFPGLIIGHQLQDRSRFQTVSSTCFHTSSHLSGRVTNFITRHQQGLREAPLSALTLGVSGLVPFLVPALYTATTFTIGPTILWAQVAYGASILSFLGGTRWGFALMEGQEGPTFAKLGYSVLPSLIAWLGLLMPLQASQLCVMGGLLLAWASDVSFKPYPPWFRSLRLVLSLFAVLSLGVSYGFCLVYEPTSEAHGSNVMKLIKIVRIILED